MSMFSKSMMFSPGKSFFSLFRLAASRPRFVRPALSPRPFGPFPGPLAPFPLAPLPLAPLPFPLKLPELSSALALACGVSPAS